MATPEAKVKQKVRKLLEEFGVYYFMPVPYGRQGIPDFVCCCQGKFLGIETKAGKNKCTKLQELEHDKIRRAHGEVLIIREDNINDLRTTLQSRITGTA